LIAFTDDSGDYQHNSGTFSSDNSMREITEPTGQDGSSSSAKHESSSQLNMAKMTGEEIPKVNRFVMLAAFSSSFMALFDRLVLRLM
jgi:hypothetical protein